MRAFFLSADFCSVLQGLFASKPAPTLDLRCTEIECGSGLAREEASTNNINYRLETR